MSNKRLSVKDQVASAISSDEEERGKTNNRFPTSDSFQNFAHKLGIGTENGLSTSTYGYNPITRNRNLLEWIHRGSWLGGVAVDLVANDMTRAGVEFKGSMKPADIEALEYSAAELGIDDKVNETIKWGRLYGGAISVMLIDGQKMNTELRIDTVGRDSFKGLVSLDRWMLEPSVGDLVTELGPSMGQPRFYTVQSNAPALRGAKIHHSRCIRMDGVKLPYQQALTENLWSLSVIERLYDRLISFDSATTGAAQLVYKSYLRTLKIKDLRELTAVGGAALDGLVQYISIMARFQSIEGVTLIDGEDDFAIHQNSTFGGIADIIGKFGEQLSGALQIPLVRLFGQSPGGLSSSGDSDLRTYYDGIKQAQMMTLGVGLTRLYKIMAKSLGKALPSDFKLVFKSLWQLQEKEKADIAKTTAESIMDAQERGIISRATALRELKQQSHTTGVFTNITDEEIAAADDEPVLPEEVASAAADQAAEHQKTILETKATAAPPETKAGRDKTGGDKNAKKRARSTDGIQSITKAQRYLGLEIAIENPKGTIRSGMNGEHSWEVVMPDDYGYVRRTKGADGDQVDCYVGPDLMSTDDVFVIDQRDLRNGGFDEHKCMLGYRSREDAIAAFKAGYTDGKGEWRIGSVTEFSVTQFRAWLQAADLTKPCSGRFETGVV